jgi:hypothetical protein
LQVILVFNPYEQTGRDRSMLMLGANSASLVAKKGKPARPPTRRVRD